MIDFGDAEAAIVAVLQSADTLTGVDVATDLNGYTGGRWLRVIRAGGMPTLWMRVDNPLIAVAAYGDTKSQALDLARAARSAVYAARGQYVGNGLRLFDVVDTEGLTWSPDERNPDQSRYLFTLALVTKPESP